jgi:hypothetical protein
MPLSLDPNRERPKKHLGGFLGLYDKPLYRDWLAWWTGFWVLVSGLAIAFPTRGSESTSTLPRWLDISLSMLLFGFLFGVLPAYLRVLIRRQLIRRRRAKGVGPESEVAIKAPSVETATPPEKSSAPTQGNAPRPAPLPTTSFRPPAAQLDAPTRLSAVDVSGLQANPTLTDASRLLPYPVARATRQLQLASDAKEAYEATLRVGEILTTVLGIMAAAWAQHQHVRTDALDRLLAAMNGRGVTQGFWLDAAQSIEKPMVDSGAGLPGLLDALKRGKGGSGLGVDLRAVVEERNAWAHGSSPRTKAEAGERLAKLLPHVERALGQSLSLAQHNWFYVENIQYQRRDASFLITASKAMGDHPDWDRAGIRSSVAVAVESFYVSTPFGLMDLTPLVVMMQCPTCQQPEVAFVDRLDIKKGVALKSFDRGHPLFDESLVDDVRALSRGHDVGTSGTMG